MKITIISIVVIALIYIFYKTYQQGHMDKNLDILLDQGAVILDVRTAREYAGGHIEGSVNRSLGSLRSASLDLDTGKAYITCCSHGLRSVKAVEILKSRGYRRVYNGGPWTELEEISSKRKPR